MSLYPEDQFLRAVRALFRAIRDMREDINDLEAFVFSLVPKDPEPDAHHKNAADPH